MTIPQIIPADNWYAVCEYQDGSIKEIPLGCFALINPQDDMLAPQAIIGMIPVSGSVFLIRVDDNTIRAKFIGYGKS